MKGLRGSNALTVFVCLFGQTSMTGCKSTDTSAGAKQAATVTNPDPSPKGLDNRVVPGASGPAAPSAPSAASSASPATSQPTLAPAPSQPGYRIAVLGDSLSDPKSFGGGFLRDIEEHCPRTRIDNFARGGHMLNQIRRVFEDSVHSQPRGSYTHVIVWGGVNDMYSDISAGRTPQKAEEDLSQIYEKAHNKGAKVVAITVSPWGGFRRYHNARRQAYTEQLNAWINQQLAQGKVDYVVDAYALLSCGQAEQLCPQYQQRAADGLHLGQLGHSVLGAALFKAVFQDCG